MIGKVSNQKKTSRQNGCLGTWGYILGFVSSICAIVGVTIFNTVVPLIQNAPWNVRERYEKSLQTINVTESKNYIDSTIGIPRICTGIEIPKTDGTTENGEKAIYVNQFYIMIAYYKEDNSLLGYFIINKDKNFHPILYRGQDVFCKTIDNIDIKYIVPKIIAYYAIGNRNDTSAYYLKFYHHHLGTMNCLTGFGVSKLGFLYMHNEFLNYVYPFDYEFERILNKKFRDKSILPDLLDGFIYRGDNHHLNYLVDEYEKYDAFDRYPINTFARFNDEYNIDLLSLLKKELYAKLGMTYSEYYFLNDNMN